MPLKILFLTPYPHSTAPSQRFRFEQYYSYLKAKEIDYKTQSFIDHQTWKILYLPGKAINKAFGIIKGFARRLKILFTLHKFNYVFIHREASPIGPPIFEWMISKVFKKKIIYDFDDAIWLPNTSEQNKLASRLKWHHKVGLICKWSYRISAGNSYLASFAKQFNKEVIINPTTIDTENVHNIIKKHHTPFYSENFNIDNKIIIGWTGSHSTLPYLSPIVPLLQNLEKDFNIEFWVISNQDPHLPIKKYTFIKWKKETEIEDLYNLDIGLMPLSDDIWAKGKCGFKALQYMALGIPALVSPVGVNTEIVRNGENGFICSSQEEWEKNIKLLIENPTLRERLGAEARKTILDNYSVLSNVSNFLSLFY